MLELLGTIIIHWIHWGMLGIPIHRPQADEEDDLLEKRKRSRLEVAEEDFRGLLAKKIRSPLEFNWKDGCGMGAGSGKEGLNFTSFFC